MGEDKEEGSPIIYLDNAATSWPKPAEVAEAMAYFHNMVGANPGRSGHRLSVEAGRILYEARENIAALFNAPDPLRVVFTSNATEAINLALRGLLKPGDHVVTGSMEHNSVMRPLRDLEKTGVRLSVVPCFGDGSVDVEGMEKAIETGTRMMVINHASNVTGTLAPISLLGGMVREHDLLFLVDVAQSGGAYPIDVRGDLVDLLAFAGHKSLFGPMGTGGLIVGERVDARELAPLKSGGTGSRSEHEWQPDFLPDLCESGTPNTVGIAGLGAGVRFVLREGVEKTRKREMELTRRLLDGLAEIPSVTLYGDGGIENRIATVSFNMANLPPSEVAMILSEDYDIMCRAGLHCAPAAHRTIGTFPVGTVRMGIGYFNAEEEIDETLEALHEIAKEA